jgi:hypothetical protein
MRVHVWQALPWSELATIQKADGPLV